MGKPAAAIGDLAAHGGTIATGSTNVLIGGRPAARVGDTVVCALHGPGVISMGSFTVLINGMPAARLGDVTGCMAPSLAPVSVPTPVLGPTPALPIEWAGSLDPKKSGKFIEDNDKSKDGVTAAHLEGRIRDTNNDGHYDTMEGALVGVRMRNAGQKDLGSVELGGTHNLDALYATARVSNPTTNAGGSLGGTAEAGMLKWGAGGTVGGAGSKGLNPAAGLSGEVNMLHAKAEGDVLVGDDGNRVGLVGKGEAGAEALKGEAVGTVTVPFFFGSNIQAVGKASAAAGTVGGGAGAWLYYDRKQGRLRGGIMGILKILVGLGGEVEVSIGRPFQEDPAPTPAPPAAQPAPPSAGAPFGGYANTPGLGAAGLPGAIMLGNPTVLIGG